MRVSGWSAAGAAWVAWVLLVGSGPAAAIDDEWTPVSDQELGAPGTPVLDLDLSWRLMSVGSTVRDGKSRAKSEIGDVGERLGPVLDLEYRLDGITLDGFSLPSGTDLGGVKSGLGDIGSRVPRVDLGLGKGVHHGGNSLP